MKLVMHFVIDENGWVVRYGEDDEERMTPAQRVSFHSLRNRGRSLRTELTEQQREHDARAAEAMQEQEPKIRRITRKVG